MTRTLLVLALLGLAVACAALMWLGYRNRRARQAAVLPALPAVPAGVLAGERADLLDPLPGVYVSTTTTESWQDRVAAGDVGFRSRATLHLHDGGVYVQRVGAEPLWLPRDGIEHARTAPGLAGKVMGGDALLVLRWTAGRAAFDTGLRADEPERYREWIDALGAPAQTTTGTTTTTTGGTP